MLPDATQLRIGGRVAGDGAPLFVIAEIGNNHQGDLQKAKEMFKAAKDCGVNAVKLQKRDNKSLLTRAAYNKPYENENSFGATYGEHREALEAFSGRGFVLTALVMSAAAIPAFWAVFVGSREVVRVAPARKVTYAEMVGAIAGNGQLLIVFLSSFLLLAGLLGRMSVVVFFYLYTVGRPELVGLLMMTQALCGALGILVFTRLASRFDKRSAVITSYFVMAVTQVGLFLTPPAEVGVVFALTALLGLAGFGAPISLSMTADAVDWYEDRTGRRNDGVAFSTMSMGPKLAGAVGGALALAIIGSFGYQAGAATQTGLTLIGISAAANLVPALFQLAAIVPLRWYVITNATYDRLRARLDARHAAVHPQPETVAARGTTQGSEQPC